MTIDSLRKIATALAILVLYGCEGWPPYGDRLESRFRENPEAFDSLRDKLLATEFDSMSVYRSHEGLKVIGDSSVVAEVRDGVEYMRWDKEEFFDQEIIDLFTKTRVANIERNSIGAVFFNPPPVESDYGLSPFITKNNRSTFFFYTRDGETSRERHECREKFEELRCGSCSISLENDWFIDYSWSPHIYDQDALDKLITGEMPESEYYAIVDPLDEQCRADGLAAIGFSPEP